MPAGVLAGTETWPVAISSVGTGAPGLAGVAGVVTETLIWASVTWVPLRVSPAITSSTLGAPFAPLTPATVSASAAIVAATTVTEMVAVLQLVGLSFSQIV